MRPSRLVICYEIDLCMIAQDVQGRSSHPLSHKVSVCKGTTMSTTNFQISLGGCTENGHVSFSIYYADFNLGSSAEAQFPDYFPLTLFVTITSPLALSRQVAQVGPCFSTWQNLYLPPPMLQKAQTMRKPHAFPKTPKTAKQPLPSIHSTPMKYHKMRRRVLLLSSHQLRIRKLWAKR